MPKDIKSSRPSLKQLQDRAQAAENNYKRALADYQNLEKRHALQRSNISKYANESLLDKILPIIDDLNRAQDHLADTGLQMILDRFQQLLTSEGVTPIDTKDQPFDPETMDCVEVVDGKKDIVVNTLSQGYFYNDKVLRPARVEVGSGQTKK